MSDDAKRSDGETYWRPGILPPAVSMGDCSSDITTYYTLYDENADERSGLSAPTRVCVDALAKATHIEIWMSVDGEPPQRWAQRKISDEKDPFSVRWVDDFSPVRECDVKE